MNKLYVSGNYVIAEDSRGVHEYPLSRSVYSLVANPAGYVIKEQIDTGELVIRTADIGNWFDEFGEKAFTEETLVKFLRNNTGCMTLPRPGLVGGGGDGGTVITDPPFGDGTAR